MTTKVNSPTPTDFDEMDRYKWLLRQQHDHNTVIGGKCDRFNPTATMKDDTAVVWCDECGVVLDRKERED